MGKKIVDQDLSRRGLVHTAGAQVEKCVIIEASHRRAVAALDVVSVDLKARNAVDHRVIGQQQVPVGLVRVGLLAVARDEDLPVEHAAGPAVQDALVELAARAVRLRMNSQHRATPRERSSTSITPSSEPPT